MRHTLTIPDWQPHRLNQLLSCHWATRGRLKRQDREMIGTYALLAGIPKAKGKRRVSLLITLGPRQRGADPDAYWKSLLDALVHAGLLVHDSPKWCDLAPVRFQRGRRRQTAIRIEDLAPSATRKTAHRDPAIWLGYRLLGDGGGLKVSLTEDAWQSLSQNLELCHTKDSSPVRAIETIRGWISQLGPCFLNTNINQAYARISELAHTLAFDEIPTEEVICRCWHQAHIRWEDCQRAQRKELAAAGSEG
jgi:hypothetical protein